MVNTTCFVCFNTCRELQTQLEKIAKQAIWLKEVIPSVGGGLSLIYLILIDLGLRDHGSKVHQTLGIILLIIIIMMPWGIVFSQKLHIHVCSH